MKVTKKEVEELLGFEVQDMKVTKRTYRGKKVVKLHISVVPKKAPEYITIQIRAKE